MNRVRHGLWEKYIVRLRYLQDLVPTRKETSTLAVERKWHGAPSLVILKKPSPASTCSTTVTVHYSSVSNLIEKKYIYKPC